MEDLKRFLARCRTYLDPRLIPGAPKQDMPSKKRQRVQNVWSLIFTGYHAGFETDPAAFATQLCGVKPIERAIIFEGAFMALTLPIRILSIAFCNCTRQTPRFYHPCFKD
jgi:hypothetical protein